MCPIFTLIYILYIFYIIVYLIENVCLNIIYITNKYKYILLIYMFIAYNFLLKDT